MSRVLALYSLTALSFANAKPLSEIISEASRSVVFLEAQDDAGEVRETGSGFIASHDGYIVTAAHVFPPGASKLYAVIGARHGPRFPLDRRELDEARDIAVWQLPQSSVCRPALTLSGSEPKVADRVVTLGFPRDEGLTPSPLTLQNLSTPTGLYRMDGLVHFGNSGGPVLNEHGLVIGIVQGGTIAGAQANDIIPLPQIVDLLRKRIMSLQPGKAPPYDASCYSTCRHPAHGIEKWGIERPWPDPNIGDGKYWTGKVGGGHNQTDSCNSLIAAYVTANPGSNIEVPKDGQHMGETSHKDILGHVEYRYWCKGTERRDPVFTLRQSSNCPLWN